MSRRKYHGPSKTEFRILAAMQSVGLKPIHQFKIPGTWYTADFYFPEYKLIVEVDGHPYHYSKKGRAHQATRDKIINALGFNVLHLQQSFLTNDVNYIANTVAAIIKGDYNGCNNAN